MKLRMCFSVKPCLNIRTMKIIPIIFSILFLKLHAQNSCCPAVNESDIVTAKCDPAKGLYCFNGTVFELDRTAFEEKEFYLDGNILVHDGGTKREFPTE